MDTVIDYIRKFGKYLTIAACIAAVCYGIIFRRFFAPFEISLACWIGLLIWGGALGAAKLKKKYLESRSKSARTH